MEAVSTNTRKVTPNWSNLNTVYHWRIDEIRGGEVWAKGIRINGKVFETMIFGADLARMEFDTLMGKMKFEVPEETFRRNVEAQYGSVESYLMALPNLPCGGRTRDFQ